MLTLRETATILAALQYWREEMCPHGRLIMRPYYLAVGCERYLPLRRDELPLLVARLKSHLRSLAN